MRDGEAFFIPTDPSPFFEANDFGPDHGAPERDGPGLSFEGACLSCGKSTEETIDMIGGVRAPGHALTWAQPLPMCRTCQAMRARWHRMRNALTALSVMVSALAGFLAVAGAGAATGLGAVGLFAVGTLAAGAVFAILRVGLGQKMLAALASNIDVLGEPLSSYHPVELFVFREPRKGPDTTVLMLSIANPSQAQTFASHNRHAIPQEAWNASYTRARGT